MRLSIFEAEIGVFRLGSSLGEFRVLFRVVFRVVLRVLFRVVFREWWCLGKSDLAPTDSYYSEFKKRAKILKKILKTQKKSQEMIYSGDVVHASKLFFAETKKTHFWDLFGKNRIFILNLL